MVTYEIEETIYIRVALTAKHETLPTNYYVKLAGIEAAGNKEVELDKWISRERRRWITSSRACVWTQLTHPTTCRLHYNDNNISASFQVSGDY